MIQNKITPIPTAMVLNGFVANSVKLDPIYAIEKIMIDLPKKTANTNCWILIFESPDTTLMTDDGENGKHINKNNGPNPCFSNQFVTLCTCLLCRTARSIRLFPNLRMIKKTKTDPRLVPIHDHRNPSIGP